MSDTNEVVTDLRLEKRTRRRFSVAEKKRLLAEAAALAHGEKGSWLRRNGLYAGQLSVWRKELAEHGEVALASAQSTGRAILRDLLGNLAAQSSKLYHLGVGLISRSSLARTNEKQHWTLYEALFSNCWGAASSRLRGMDSGSITSFSHSTHRPSMCACRCSPGQSSIKPRRSQIACWAGSCWHASDVCLDHGWQDP